MSAPAATATPGAAEALRRIKETERSWEEKLATARREAESEQRQLSVDSAAAIKAALVEAEQARAGVVGAARAAAEREAEGIESAGAEEARSVTAAAKGLSAAQKEALLDAVLGELRA